MNTITVTVSGGPSITVPWVSGMNAQQALEAANKVNQQQFTYAIQYFASLDGYLVVMINGTYESFLASGSPYYYWEFFLNGTAQKVGIDKTTLNIGDTISFGRRCTRSPVTSPRQCRQNMNPI